jgi:hypothetical protein
VSSRNFLPRNLAALWGDRSPGRYRRWRFLPRRVFRLLTGLQRDVLFVWVPKCAGTSIYTTLVKYGCAKERWGDPLQPFDNRGMVTFGHVDVLQLAQAGIIERAYFERAFKFAFVRNPFDRAVSLYRYLRRIRNEAVPPETTFSEFCESVGGGDYPPVGLYNYRGLNQCNPIVRWLTDSSGKLIVDFVGRYENLEADFQEACRRIGIREPIPHKNSTRHMPYREHYDDHTRAIIERVYREDLERFGYSF